MDTITIYRVDNDAQEGPWLTSNGSVADRLASHGYEKPLFHVDLGIQRSDLPYCIVCGVDDLALLAYWFDNPDVIDVMQRNGFTVTEYEVPSDSVRYTTSGMQVGFDITKAVEKGRHCLSLLI